MTTLPVMTETLLTLPQASEYLAERGRPVVRETVYRWVKAGKLPAQRRKFGRTFFVRASDLDALLELEDVA